MMQEGVLSYSNGRFNDSTVVRLSRSIKHHEGKLYLGLRLFDIPEGSQVQNIPVLFNTIPEFVNGLRPSKQKLLVDYTIVDVTRAIDEEERTKVEMITDSFRLMVKVSKEHEITKGRSVKSCLISDQSTSPLRALRDKPVMCECSLNTCACCAFLAVDKIRLHNDVCVNLTYLPEDIGIKLSLSIDNRVVFSDELSVRNPPPMDFRKQHLIGCVELDVELYHVRITRANLGCFNLPVDA
ncbi:unnamed protein product [Toxocara canis]|uniref:DUF4773 domain-containing protein n=1 Tax=Toxocara canis TaxID=6265 RepID=A0A183UEP8_TOXCA|nr:unnamed protein product [Toxocara canis]